jgi:NADPH:quinone reductase-like Zn-dependent oxidoreductase
MRAAVLAKQGGIRIEERPLPQVGADEVLI